MAEPLLVGTASTSNNTTPETRTTCVDASQKRCDTAAASLDLLYKLAKTVKEAISTGAKTIGEIVSLVGQAISHYHDLGAILAPYNIKLPALPGMVN